MRYQTADFLSLNRVLFRIGMFEDRPFVVPPAPYVRREMGGRIRTARHRRGLTQTQLAECAGVGQPWIAKLELGRASASPAQIRVICQVLQVSADALLAL